MHDKVQVKPPKRQFLSPDFVRAMLAGHSALGLAFAALIYIVCLTGTVSVFLMELQRWEQPDGPRVTETPSARDGRGSALEADRSADALQVDVTAGGEKERRTARSDGDRFKAPHAFPYLFTRIPQLECRSRSGRRQEGRPASRTARWTAAPPSVPPITSITSDTSVTCPTPPAPGRQCMSAPSGRSETVTLSSRNPPDWCCQSFA